jgi:hypothetical protein
MQITMNTAMIAEASGRLTFSRPSLIGLAKKSPAVAPQRPLRSRSADQTRPTVARVHSFAKILLRSSSNTLNVQTNKSSLRLASVVSHP